MVFQGHKNNYITLAVVTVVAVGAAFTVFFLLWQ